MGGALTVARYMGEALTNPSFGFYMKSDVFGQAGHFVTAPEVSQVFGELMAIWTASVWEQLGRPGKLHVVEFGPGRGTLMNDVLRVCCGMRRAWLRECVSGSVGRSVGPAVGLRERAASIFRFRVRLADGRTD